MRNTIFEEQKHRHYSDRESGCWNVCQKITFVYIFFLRYELMLACWEPEPEHRPTFAQLWQRLSYLYQANKVGSSHNFCCLASWYTGFEFSKRAKNQCISSSCENFLLHRLHCLLYFPPDARLFHSFQQYVNLADFGSEVYVDLVPLPGEKLWFLLAHLILYTHVHTRTYKVNIYCSTECCFLSNEVHL